MREIRKNAVEFDDFVEVGILYVRVVGLIFLSEYSES